MSQINVNTITDEAGTGPVNFPYDFTIAGSALVIPPAHSATTVSGATQALNVGSYNFFNANDLTVDTTLSFTSVPTNALWTYTAKTKSTEEYTVEAAVYTGLSKIVNTQDGLTTGIAFSSDGTKMYIIGYQYDTVHQYTLGTAWDVSTATYASLSFSVAAQELTPQDLTFSTDGTKMYIVGNTNDTVYQYTLSTAWAINTATYASLSKSIAAQEIDPTGVAFSSDGTEMYVCGNNGDDVNQYTLSTAWNISTASFTTVFSVAAQDTVPTAIAFSSDGLKMFIVGAGVQAVLQYTLSTAWNISTATYASLSFSVTAQETGPSGLAFSSDGTKMYVIGQNTDTVYQYTSTLPASITVPAAVQNPPTSQYLVDDQVSYTFVTNDGGTTVRLINEVVL